MNNKDEIIKWLLEGEFSIQYQVNRDLLKSKNVVLNKLQQRIEKEGWGKEFLSKQREELDYFQDNEVKYDKRMDSALEILIKKKGKDGKWPLQMKILLKFILIWKKLENRVDGTH